MKIETVKRGQDKIGVFMTAIMSRKRREGKEERCEVETLKKIQDKIGVFMTAIMTRMEEGEREKEEPQRDHRRKRVAPGCRLFLAEFFTTHFVWFDTNSLNQSGSLSQKGYGSDHEIAKLNPSVRRAYSSPPRQRILC